MEIKRIKAWFNGYGKRIYRLIVGHPLLIASVLSLAVVLSLGFLHSSADILRTADSTSVTYMWGDDGYATHSVLATNYHNFFIKLPFFYVENLLGLSVLSQSILSWIFIGLMLAMLAYVMYRVSGKMHAAVSLLLLNGFLAMIDPSLHLNNISMPTMRNLEFGLFFLAYLLIYLAKSRVAVISSVILLAALFVTDPMFVPYGLGASALMLAVFAAKSFIVGRVNDDLYRSVKVVLLTVVSVLVQKIILVLIAVTGLFVVSNKSDDSYITSMAESLYEVNRLLIDAVNSILITFGVHIDGQKIGLSLMFIGISGVVGVVVIIFSARNYIKLLVQSLRIGKTDAVGHYVLFCGAVILTSVAAFILTQHRGGVSEVRFLHIILFAVMILFSYSIKFVKEKLLNRILLGAMAVVSFMALGGLIQSYDYAKSTRANYYQTWNSTAEAIIDNKIETVAGDYFVVYPLKAYLADKYDYGIRLLPLQQCHLANNTYVDARWFSEDWVERNGQTAQIVRGGDARSSESCNDNELEARFGKREKLDVGSSVVLYLSSGDIVDSIDRSQIEEKAGRKIY